MVKLSYTICKNKDMEFLQLKLFNNFDMNWSFFSLISLSGMLFHFLFRSLQMNSVPCQYWPAGIIY